MTPFMRPIAKNPVKIGDVAVGREPVLCASVGENDIFEMVSYAKAVGSSADLVELRLDYLDDVDDTDVERELAKEEIDCPTILTIRKENEGGNYSGSEKRRADLFEEYIDYVDAVDLEYHTADNYRRRIVQRAKESGLPVIFSYHNFSRTGSVEEIRIRLEECLEMGDIAKVATMIQSSKDALNLLHATLETKKESGKPLTTIGMGGRARHLRAVLPIYGADLVYASVREETGPGQFSLEQINEIMDLLEI